MGNIVVREVKEIIIKYVVPYALVSLKDLLDQLAQSYPLAEVNNRSDGDLSKDIDRLSAAALKTVQWNFHQQHGYNYMENGSTPPYREANSPVFGSSISAYCAEDVQGIADYAKYVNLAIAQMIQVDSFVDDLVTVLKRFYAYPPTSWQTFGQTFYGKSRAGKSTRMDLYILYVGLPYKKDDIDKKSLIIAYASVTYHAEAFLVAAAELGATELGATELGATELMANEQGPPELTLYRQPQVTTTTTTTTRSSKGQAEVVTVTTVTTRT